MKHSLILKFSAVIALLFGLALALAPNQLAAVYRVPEMNEGGVYNSMLYGAFLIGTAIMNWAASNAPSAEQARYVILGNFASMVLSLIVALQRQMESTAMPMGWVNVVIFAVFTVLFGYLYFSRSSVQAAAGAG